MAAKTDQWCQDHIDRLHTMRMAGHTPTQIAEALGVPVSRIKGRLRWQNLAPWQLERQRDQTRARRKKEYVPSLHAERPYLGPKTSSDIMAEREARYAAPHRDLAGAFFGDPPVGYSALERRA